jgi:hypothetical protein
LTLSNIVFEKAKSSFSGAASALRSFDLTVAVDRDPTASSPIASKPSLPSPDSLPEVCQKAFDTLYLDQFRKGGH